MQIDGFILVGVVGTIFFIVGAIKIAIILSKRKK